MNWIKKNGSLLRMSISILIVLFMEAISILESVDVLSSENFLNSPILGLSLFLVTLGLTGYIFMFSFFEGIYKAIAKKPREGSIFGIDGLATLSIIIAFAYSLLQLIYHFSQDFEIDHYFFDVAASLCAFGYIGKFVEEKIEDRSSEAMKDLVSISPVEAEIHDINTKTTRMIPVSELKFNDIVLVKKGAKISADGIVVEGKSYVDQAVITGEENPVYKEDNSSVIAGTMNLSNDLLIRVQKNHEDSMISEIIKVVQETQKTKPKVQKLADTIANIFIPIIFSITIGVFLLSWFTSYQYEIFGSLKSTGNNFFDSANIAILTLVIACPAGFILSTPLAVLVGSTKAAKLGILYKRSDVFERVKKVNAICFDKTGTLTMGKPQVVAVYGPESNLEIIMSAEKQISHPVATSIVDYCYDNNLHSELKLDVEEVLGFGVKTFYKEKSFHIGSKKYMDKLNLDTSKIDSEVDWTNNASATRVYFSDEKEVFNLILVKDQIRSSAKKVIEKLRKRGIEVFLITGDNEQAATEVANQLGIKNFFANVLPNEKLDYVKKIQKDYKKVAFVGDGVNDAPALVGADLSMAMGSGTSIAIDSADITLVNSDIASIDIALQISNKTLRNIYENFAFAILYNLITIPLAAIGLFLFVPAVAPLLGALSDVIVAGNSWRLKFFNPIKIKD